MKPANYLSAMKSTSVEEQKIKRQQDWLPVFVVFTTVQHTLLSLRTAAQLTRDLEARVQLLVPDSDLSPDSPITFRMLADFTARYFLTMLPHRADLQIKIVSYPAITGDLWEVVPPHSLIVIAGNKRRFLLSAEQRFARQLQRAGHEVIFLPALA